MLSGLKARLDFSSYGFDLDFTNLDLGNRLSTNVNETDETKNKYWVGIANKYISFFNQHTETLKQIKNSTQTGLVYNLIHQEFKKLSSDLNSYDFKEINHFCESELVEELNSSLRIARNNLVRFYD